MEAAIRVVTKLATEVREFMEPRFGVLEEGSTTLSPSEGYCFKAAAVLACALNDHFGEGQWMAGEGVFASDAVLLRLKQGELPSWSDIEDAGCCHGWVVSADGEILVDITADQFGLAPVVVLEAHTEEGKPWLPRYFPDLYPSDGTEKLIRAWYTEKKGF